MYRSKQAERGVSEGHRRSGKRRGIGGWADDYVTKRPAMVKDLDLATDHRGTAYGAVDLGHLFGSRKQVGARVNLAGERIASYMIGTNGWRAVGAALLTGSWVPGRS